MAQALRRPLPTCDFYSPARSRRVKRLPKLLLIWNSTPRRGGGAELLMNRMFQDYPRESLFALTSASAARASKERDGAVPAANLFTAPEYQIRRRVLWRVSQFISWLLLPVVVWRGVRLIRQFQIDAIFTVPWSQFYAAAYLVHRITAKPLFIYVMDDHEGKASPGWLLAPFYSFFMPRAIRAARAIWCVSQGMCESILQRFGKETLLLLPTADVSEFSRFASQRDASRNPGFRIIYTGAIYGMQLDALQHLTRVVDDLPAALLHASKVELILYTSAGERYLRKIGFVLSANTRLDEVDNRLMPQTLADADILYLPMAFDPALKHMVATSIPSKIAEYLASGVPVLAHGPAYCSAVRYCRENDCASIVDQPGDHALRAALVQLANDATLRRRLSERAREVARAHHDAGRVVAKFLEELAASQWQPQP